MQGEEHKLQIPHNVIFYITLCSTDSSVHASSHVHVKPKLWILHTYPVSVKIVLLSY